MARSLAWKKRRMRASSWQAILVYAFTRANVRVASASLRRAKWMHAC